MRKRAQHAWPWFGLGFDSLKLAIEAQQVIALRLAKLATGGPAASREATRMVTEKIAALTAAQALLLRGARAGQAPRAAHNTVRLYRRRVAANKRRLG
jgi:hypothetical protein